jgi:hypothetical protein
MSTRKMERPPSKADKGSPDSEIECVLARAEMAIEKSGRAIGAAVASISMHHTLLERHRPVLSGWDKPIEEGYSPEQLDRLRNWIEASTQAATEEKAQETKEKTAAGKGSRLRKMRSFA